MEIQIYPIDRQLNTELLKLSNSDLSANLKNAITDFIDELSIQNITKYRQYFYAIRLRKMAFIIGESMLKPDKESIKKLLAKLKNSKTRRGGPYSENSMSDFKTTLKKFYRWFHEGKYLASVSWISSKTMPSHAEKPDFVITEDEVKRMLYACQNTRDKALIALLYDSGCRIGELLSLKIKDVEFDEYGASLLVHGKTGNRWVRVVGNSVPLLHDHIGPRDSEGFLFEGLEGNARGKPMSWALVNKAMRSISRRADLKRHIHAHLFRHTRATILASLMKEAPLEAQMGWKHGSRMTQVYVHFSRVDLDRAVLRAYGIDMPDDTPGTGEKMPKKCSRCSMINESDATYCKRCAFPLNPETMAKFDEGKRKIESKVLESDYVSDSSKDMIRNFDPIFKDKILESVIGQIIKEHPELIGKFLDSKN